MLSVYHFVNLYLSLLHILEVKGSMSSTLLSGGRDSLIQRGYICCTLFPVEMFLPPTDWWRTIFSNLMKATCDNSRTCEKGFTVVLKKKFSNKSYIVHWVFFIFLILYWLFKLILNSHTFVPNSEGNSEGFYPVQPICAHICPEAMLVT